MRIVGRADLELQRGAKARFASRAARCSTAAPRRRSAARGPSSCARFQRWNTSSSSSVCASSIASPLPLSANQRASSDLPERGGPVSTAVRNGQLCGSTQRLGNVRVGLADDDPRRAGRPAASAEGRSATSAGARLAPDGKRVAGRSHLATRANAAPRPDRTCRPAKVTRMTEVPPIAMLLIAAPRTPGAPRTQRQRGVELRRIGRRELHGVAVDDLRLARRRRGRGQRLVRGNRGRHAPRDWPRRARRRAAASISAWIAGLT